MNIRGHIGLGNNSTCTIHKYLFASFVNTLHGNDLHELFCDRENEKKKCRQY